MIGAIAGDIIGSVHERAGTKRKDFPLFVPECRFSDDTVLTVAVGDRLLHGGDYAEIFHRYFHRYPQAGYGGRFVQWAQIRTRAVAYLDPPLARIVERFAARFGGGK